MADTTITLYGAAGCTAVTPLFNFSAGTVKVYIEDVYIKDLTSNVADNIALTVGQKLQYTCSNWNSVTKIDIHGDKVSGDISGWTLPSSPVYFSVYNTSVSGDISGWTLPSSLVYFSVSSTSVSGGISGWTLPSSLVSFYVNKTSVSGDISGWTLPSSLVYFSVSGTSVSGDISGWTLPSSLVYFYVNNTSVSGDISGWTLPSSLVYFYVNNTSVSYNRAVGVFAGITNNLNKIDFDNCSLIQTQVDNILANCVASGIDNSVSAKTLDVGDSNAAPSGIGFMNKKILESRGWTVKITAATFYTNPNGIQMSRTGQHFSSFQEI